MKRLKQALNLAAFAAGRLTPMCGPAKVTWDVTHRCNLKCKHCHLWQVKDHNDLTTDEAKVFISDLADMGTLHLSFSGGEPYLRKDMHELTAFSRDKGLTTAVNTNGTLLKNRDTARKVCEAGMGTVFVSLDGADAETHNALRGNPHAFDLVLGSIDNLVELRNGSAPRVFINTTVTPDNVDSLQGIIDLGRSHGVDGMTMSVIQDIDKYAPEADMDFRGEGASDLTGKLLALAKESNGLIPHAPEYLEHFQTYLERPGKLYDYRCSAGYAMASVLPNGDVHPCPVPFASMGNLRERSFSEIWFGGEAERIRTRIRENNHPICWFDCIAPLNVLLHNMRWLRLDKMLHKNTMIHILNKTSRG